MSEANSKIKWHNKTEVAAHFGIGKRTVTDWMRRRLIPFVKVGHVVRFNLLDCESAIRNYQVKSKE
jgi:excisionase family DNA binding protein